MNENQFDHQSDHDILIRISEQVSGLRLSLESDRTSWNLRASKHESELKDLEKEVESLRISRATLYGMTVALSAIVSTLIKVFWK